VCHYSVSSLQELPSCMCKTPSEFAFPPPATIKALTVELAGLTAKPGVDEVAVVIKSLITGSLVGPIIPPFAIA
jgi:hypothetical protein